LESVLPGISGREEFSEQTNNHMSITVGIHTPTMSPKCSIQVTLHFSLPVGSLRVQLLQVG